MTPTQAAILKSLRRTYGTKKARGIIPMHMIYCLDFRSFRGLLERKEIVIDQYGRYMLNKELTE